MKIRTLFMFVILLAITACNSRTASIETSAISFPAETQAATTPQSATPVATPTATLSPASEVNQWQKDLMDLSIAVAKFLLTIVILGIVAVLILLGFIGIFSWPTARQLGEGIRKILSSLRRSQIVVSEFDNATDDKDYLTLLVRALLAEKIRADFRPDGPLGRIRKSIAALTSSQGRKNLRAPLDTEENSARDMLSDSLNDLTENTAATEIKLLSMIIRWLFPVPGVIVQGHLVKTGDVPQDHRLLVELVDLVSGNMLDTNEFWEEPAVNDTAPRRVPDKGKKGEPPDADPAAVYEKLTEKAALWAGAHALIEDLKISSMLRPLKRKLWAQIHNYVAYSFMQYGLTHEAIKEYHEAIDADENEAGMGNWYVPYWNLGDEYSYSGQQEKSLEKYLLALKVIEKTGNGNEDIPTIRVAAACSLWHRGSASDKEQALEIVESVEDENIVDNKGLAYNLACFYAIAGHNKNAIKWLDIALKDASYLSWVQDDPDMAALRKRPEYKKLITRHLNSQKRYRL